ncbi:MAG: type I-E CRISPR-associated protein Cse2/CasB [Dehalococcoidales bacterium]|nr:type I-E CRISPR-associated protein Cse2/CasB [Dehalococcoidales bacterium]
MSTIIAQEHKFIGHLEKLVKEQDLGALAALRRGLGKPPGTTREMDSNVLPYLPPNAGEHLEDAYYLIGTLFAFWHQGSDSMVKNQSGNMGASLRALVDQETVDGGDHVDAEKRVEKRLVALLNCHYDDLPDHLRHTIGLLKSKDIPVNWLLLLNDIQNWQRESRDVQRQWAREFWRNFKKSETP